LKAPCALPMACGPLLSELSYTPFFFLQMSSPSYIRVVHAPAPADNPADDLHIWRPLQVSGEGVFTKEVPVSDALCAFLSLPFGSKISRSKVTRGIIAYTKIHGLMRGQKIALDDALRDLLGPTPDLNILNLQQYLRPHYLFEEDELGFEAWWTARESPLWIGVNVDGFSTHALYTLYKTLTRYPSVQFVCYTGIPTSDSEAPCGCYGRDGTCDYHREEEPDTAPCGCSVSFRIKCAYHNE
jgi:hypothetical protein